MNSRMGSGIRKYRISADEEKVFNNLSGFMLIYVNEGHGTFSLNGEEKDFVPGTTVIMTCLDYLKKLISAETTEITVLEFSETTFSGRIPEFFSIRSLPIYTVFEEDREKMEVLLELVAASVEGNQQSDDIFLKNLSKELVIYTLKNCDSQITNPVHDIKTELALLYIYEHFKETVSIEAVAAHVHYSVNYFYHNFQKNMGTTFQRFLHDLRMDYAVNLMRFTDLSVSDICYDCGYNSVQYFSTVFRKKFGQSPKKFISNIKIKEKKL